jgi:hypothetical protein
MSLESGQYIDDGCSGHGSPAAKKGFATSVGAYRKQVWISGVLWARDRLGLSRCPAISRQHPFRRDSHLPREAERRFLLRRYCATRDIQIHRHSQDARGLVSVETRQQGSDGQSVTTRNSSTTRLLGAVATRPTWFPIFTGRP